MKCLIFDIETAPEPDSVLEVLFTFDETAVKNYHLLASESEPRRYLYCTLFHRKL